MHSCGQQINWRCSTSVSNLPFAEHVPYLDFLISPWFRGHSVINFTLDFYLQPPDSAFNFNIQVLP